MAKKKLYKRIVTVEFLSENPMIAHSISSLVIESGCVDSDISMNIVSGGEDIQLIGDEAVNACYAHGTDTEFFQMDKQGNEIEDEDE